MYQIRKDYRFKSGFLVVTNLDTPNTDVTQFYRPKINLPASKSEGKSGRDHPVYLNSMETQKPAHHEFPMAI